ncbi:hypothetical protein ACHIPZ_13865 [Antrihabitans sp. NCIMB 15449]|uniref:Uncharacterized protein n=1 Tax=Antrihabitans spumae TaxID=3373370 RepID=A0ABW7JND5_9NOCA
MRSVPDEAEIRAFAEKVGAIDEAGNYTAPRAKLAQGALAYRDEIAKDEAAEDVETTAEQLVRLHRELSDLIDPSAVDQLVLAIAPALVTRHGLQLKSKGTRTA